MASSTQLRIELAPHSSSQRRQRAYTDPSTLSDVCQTSPHQLTLLGPQGAGHSSGYMSSCSSPRVLLKPHPSWQQSEDLLSEQSDDLGQGNVREQHRQQQQHAREQQQQHARRQQQQHAREQQQQHAREQQQQPQQHARRQQQHAREQQQQHAREQQQQHTREQQQQHTREQQQQHTLHDSIYSRLDHSANSTLTRRTSSQQTTPPWIPSPNITSMDHEAADQFSDSVPFRSSVGVKRQRSPGRSPLAVALETLGGLDKEVKRWLLKADQHLKWEEFESAIPFLESVIVRTQMFARLQLVLWEFLGNAQLAVGKAKKASVCYLHHMAHCRAQGDFKGLTRAECNLGITYMHLGLLKLAGRCFLQYLKKCRSLQDEVGVECACSNLGMLSKSLALKNYHAAMGRGDEEAAMACLEACLRRAIIFFKQHLEVVLSHADMDKQGRAYGNIGNCYELLKEYPEAIFYHQKRLEVARATGDMYSELCTLCNLGNCLRAKGSLNQALQHYLMNLELAQSLGNWKVEQLVQHNLGLTYELLNQRENAISCYTLYLGMAVQSSDMKKQAQGFSTLARLYMQTGQILKAHEFYVTLVGMLQKLGDHASLSSAQLQLKAVRQLMKEGKKRKSHTPSKKRHTRTHTLSRASNVHRDVSGSASGRGMGEQARNKAGTWSTGARPRPQLNSDPTSAFLSGDFAPDPILAMADVAPLWEGPVGGRGYSGTSGYPMQPVSMKSCDLGLERHCHHAHQLSCDSLLEMRSQPSCESLLESNYMYGSSSHSYQRSRDYDYCDIRLHDHTHSSTHRGPSHHRTHDSAHHGPTHQYRTHDSTHHDPSQHHTHNSAHHGPSQHHTHNSSHRGPSQHHTHNSDYYNEHRYGYELVHLPSATPTSSEEDGDLLSATPTSSEGEVTTGRSTALPSLSYHSSTSSFLDVGVSLGRGSAAATFGSVDEDEVTNSQEFHRVGLELARAGLELAGYDIEGAGGLDIEEGADKEWEQWLSINEEEPGAVFGSRLSVAGLRRGGGGGGRGRGQRQVSSRRRMHSASAPDLDTSPDQDTTASHTPLTPSLAV